MTPITQTGIKGFLLWFKREQPHLFDKIAPQLPAVVPSAFSNYTARQNTLKNIYRAGLNRGGVGGFSDYELPALTVYSSAPASAPISVDYTSQIAASMPAFDTSGSLSTVSIPPVAAAANSGTASSGIASAIAQTVGAASQIYMTNAQANLQQGVIQSQLQRAAAGLPPLNTSLAQLGVPVVSTSGSISSGALVVLGIAAAIALAMGSRSKTV